MSIANDAAGLRANISEIRSAMDSGIQPSHLAGKLLDLLNKTEVAVTNALRDHFRQSGMDYDVSLRADCGQGKALDRLTLGQVICCLRKINQHDEWLRPEEFDALDLINDNVKAHHSRGQEQRLVSDARNLLDAVDVLTSSALMHR